MISPGAGEDHVPCPALADIFIGEDQVLDAALALRFEQEFPHLRAAGVVEHHQVIRPLGVLPQALQADLQHLQAFGVVPAQERYVGDNSHCDPLGLWDVVYELGRVLSNTHG